MLNIAVLVSGGGTNLQALLDAQGRGEIVGGEIAAVISSNPSAYALERARAAGVPGYVMPRRDYPSSQAMTVALTEKLQSLHIDLVVLAGFMTILTGELFQAFPQAVINVHPSLIPSFCGAGCYGLHVHEKALEYGVKVSGATVHFVSEECDGGPIVLQKAVEIREGDTPEVLRVRDLHYEVDGRDLFGGLDWEVHAGERWLIVGPNGSGKSTLLSLIVGDSPRAYACDITRFGQRLGPGVPLWALRSRMATVSPEMQACADPAQTVEAAALSGLFDREGRRRRPTPAQRKRAVSLLSALGLHERLRDPLGTLSDGLARLALVVRALTPGPDLLLLDELCMNLEDDERKRLLRLLGRLLDETPSLTVLCVAHRPDHVPPGFDRTLRLGGDHA